jgi:hypothetical protein
MKKRPLTFILVLLISIPLLAQRPIPEAGLNSLSPVEFQKHLEYLSSDDMKGRDTPSPELDTCAHYIARFFRDHGLKPVGQEESYFQYFNVLRSQLSQPNDLKIMTDTGETTYQIKQDFVPIHFTANRKIEGPLVFAGYGITAPEYNYNDYANIDVTGKIVLVFTHEPQENDSTSIFDGKKMTDHSKLFEKAVNAREHGAIGMLVVTDPNNHRFRRPPNPWPSLMKRAPKDAVPLTVEEKMENKIVAMRIGKKLANAIFEGSGKTMEELQSLIDADLIPQSFEISDKIFIMETNLSFERQQTQNVVGLWEGSDEKGKNEILVIGAHYDHLGATNDTTIYNGADDNASGTVGVMSLAKAFHSAQIRPKRSLLFCAWAGEEKGLFGSRYYVNSDPLFPLENTVVNINLDMIGRNDSSEVTISGFTSSEDLKRMTLELNKSIGLEIDSSKAIRGSDHVPFYSKEIPVLGFFTGTHSDYHKPTDTVDKCFPEGAVQILQLVYKIAWQITDADELPKYQLPKQ